MHFGATRDTNLAMARMYPRSLLDADVKTDSERRVFEHLRDGLPDEWDAFHSASWIERDPVEGAQDGEIDFVLCHPQAGLLCLEVKGGGIESQHGVWYRTNRKGGGRKRIEDPFGQALDHRYALERLLKPVFHGRKPRIGHALVMPFASVHKLALAPDAPREILIDRKDLEDIEAALERVLAFHRGARDRRAAPGNEGTEAVRNLLAPQVEIRVPMAAEFLDEEEALVLLTHEQSMLLARMRRDHRMVIRGCAGSGKTMLAVEHARRLAADDRRVGFVCFNRALRDHLRKTSRVDGVTYQTFHGLCTALGHRAKSVSLPKQEDAPPEYFEVELPDALVEAVAELGDQFDALIVDEAQDLSNYWLDALLCTLANDEDDPVWLFMDDNQRVYEARLDVPREFRPFDLTVNCRNTQTIHQEVMKLYEGDVIPEVRGPEGRPVEVYNTDEPAAAVIGAVKRLHETDEVLLEDIVVLSSHGTEKSAVAAALPERVRFSSVRAFKGLESPVVVLCELEDLDDMTKNKQLYVAISRAKNHLVVVLPGG